MKLKYEITVDYRDTPITLPEGTPITRVPLSKIMHGKPRPVELYAVAGTMLLSKLIGNDHDPKYYYCFVPAEAVDLEEDQNG